MILRKFFSLAGHRLLRKEFHAIRHCYFNKLPMIQSCQLYSTMTEPEEIQLSRQGHTPRKEMEWLKQKNGDIVQTNETSLSLKEYFSRVRSRKKIGMEISDETLKIIKDRISIDFKLIKSALSEGKATSKDDNSVINICQFLLELTSPLEDLKELQDYLLNRKTFMKINNLTHLMTLSLEYPKFGEMFDTQATIMQMWESCCHTKYKDITLMLQLIGKANLSKQQSIGDKVFMALPYMTQDNVFEVIKTCSKYGMRMHKVLMQYAESFTKPGLMVMSLHDYSTLLFCFQKLTISPVNAITRICECLDTKTELKDDIHVNKTILSSVRSLAALGYKDVHTLNNLSQKLFKDVSSENSELNYNSFSTLMHSLALLNYLPESLKSESLVDFAKKMLDVRGLKKSVWLDSVWSMAVLNIADGTLIDSVLNEEFNGHLKDENVKFGIPSYMRKYQELKLLNIDYAAQFDLENYTGSRLNKKEFHSEFITANFKTQVKTTKKIILDIYFVINELAGKNEKCYKTDTLVPDSAYSIDVELLVDKDGKLLPLDAKQEENEDRYRIAIKVLGFDALMINEPFEVRGYYAIALRHLKKLGYKVLEIRYKDWPARGSDVNTKAKFLREKILESITDS